MGLSRIFCVYNIDWEKYPYYKLIGEVIVEDVLKKGPSDTQKEHKFTSIYN